MSETFIGVIFEVPSLGDDMLVHVPAAIREIEAEMVDRGLQAHEAPPLPPSGIAHYASEAEGYRTVIYWDHSPLSGVPRYMGRVETIAKQG